MKIPGVPAGYTIFIGPPAKNSNPKEAEKSPVPETPKRGKDIKNLLLKAPG